MEGKQGTYRDAEDGELSGSNIEHGGVDSVMRLKIQLAPQANDEICYWIVAANSHDAQYLCEQIHEKLLGHGTEERENATRSHWANWLHIAQPTVDTMPAEYQMFTKKSLMLIKAHIDARGSILASADSSILNYGRDYYCYSWPRDAAFALWPLMRLGYTAEAKQYFIFCRDVITKGGYLMHKYLPDRSVGSTWHASVQNGKKELAIQEDETAIIIIMLSEFLKASNEVNFIAPMYDVLIKPMADFLVSFVDEQTNLPHASFDLWEEKFLTNTYTVACVEHALYRAAEMAE
jgi:GH15 family glucan-1,4-alpha-glucosidase